VAVAAPVLVVTLGEAAVFPEAGVATIVAKPVLAHGELKRMVDSVVKGAPV
jgi:hypothetical protein